MMEHEITIEELTGACFICGAPSLPGRVCDLCNSKKCSGRRMPIPDVAMNNALRLAGEVVALCLSEYRSTYRAAIENFSDKSANRKFRLLDKEFHGKYYDDLSMGNMDTLLQGCRKEVEASLKHEGKGYFIEQYLARYGGIK